MYWRGTRWKEGSGAREDKQTGKEREEMGTVSGERQGAGDVGRGGETW